jgi:hypothetical protein
LSKPRASFFPDVQQTWRDDGVRKSATATSAPRVGQEANKIRRNTSTNILGNYVTRKCHLLQVARG